MQIKVCLSLSYRDDMSVDACARSRCDADVPSDFVKGGVVVFSRRLGGKVFIKIASRTCIQYVLINVYNQDLRAVKGGVIAIVLSCHAVLALEFEGDLPYGTRYVCGARVCDLAMAITAVAVHAYGHRRPTCTAVPTGT